MNTSLKASALNDEQKVAIINATFERVRARDHLIKLIYTLFCKGLLLLFLTLAGERLSSIKWGPESLNLLLTLCVVAGVYFLYKHVFHRTQYKNARELAKAINCDPDDFTTHDVLLYILTPMVKQGKWPGGVSEKLNA